MILPSSVVIAGISDVDVLLLRLNDTVNGPTAGARRGLDVLVLAACNFVVSELLSLDDVGFSVACEVEAAVASSCSCSSDVVAFSLVSVAAAG